MKKLLKRVLPCFCLIAFFSACGDDDNNNKSGGDLTPDENKAKLESIAKNLVGKIDPQAHKSLVLLADDFYEFSESLEIEGAVDVMQTVKQICEKSDAGSMMAFTRASSNIYVASSYYGIYTYDKGRWIRTDSNNTLEFRFNPSLIP